MSQSHGGKRANSGRKPKKADPTLQNALAEAVPYEKWVSIFTNIANIADQQEDKRAAIMAARELRQLRALEQHSAEPTPTPSAPENKPRPFNIIYENYNHRPQPAAELASAHDPLASISLPVPAASPIASPHLPLPSHPNVKPKPRPISPIHFAPLLSRRNARPPADTSHDPKGFHAAVYPPHMPHPPQLPLVLPLLKNPSGLLPSPQYALRE